MQNAAPPTVDAHGIPVNAFARLGPEETPPAVAAAALAIPAAFIVSADVGGLGLDGPEFLTAVWLLRLFALSGERVLDPAEATPEALSEFLGGRVKPRTCERYIGALNGVVFERRTEGLRLVPQAPLSQAQLSLRAEALERGDGPYQLPLIPEVFSGHAADARVPYSAMRELLLNARGRIGDSVAGQLRLMCWYYLIANAQGLPSYWGDGKAGRILGMCVRTLGAKRRALAELEHIVGAQKTRRSVWMIALIARVVRKTSRIDFAKGSAEFAGSERESRASCAQNAPSSDPSSLGKDEGQPGGEGRGREPDDRHRELAREFVAAFDEGTEEDVAAVAYLIANGRTEWVDAAAAARHYRANARADLGPRAAAAAIASGRWVVRAKRPAKRGQGRGPSPSAMTDAQLRAAGRSVQSLRSSWSRAVIAEGEQRFSAVFLDGEFVKEVAAREPDRRRNSRVLTFLAAVAAANPDLAAAVPDPEGWASRSSDAAVRTLPALLVATHDSDPRWYGAPPDQLAVRLEQLGVEKTAFFAFFDDPDAPSARNSAGSSSCRR